jgi:hypothetical protein
MQNHGNSKGAAAERAKENKHELKAQDVAAEKRQARGAQCHINKLINEEESSEVENSEKRIVRGCDKHNLSHCLIEIPFEALPIIVLSANSV